MSQQSTCEAAFAESMAEGVHRCLLCPHHCVLSPGEQGPCGVRSNIRGRLLTETYCRPATMSVRTIESMLLYHFMPATSVLSLGPDGCPLQCRFCGRAATAQSTTKPREYPPDQLVAAALRYGTNGIVFDGHESMLFFETIQQIAPLLRQRSTFTAMTTNGYIEPRPLRELLHAIDAFRIGIKSMNPHFYEDMCGGRLEPVLRACEQVKAGGRHLEIRYAVMPNLNDSEQDIHALVRFISQHLGVDTPLHLSPPLKIDQTSGHPFSAETFDRIYEIARVHLEFVFIGNTMRDSRADTFCPSCRTVLISRQNNSCYVHHTHMEYQGAFEKCARCGARLNLRLNRA